MKKLDFGQATGILANLGVLVGVLLLVYELSQTRRITEAQTRSDLSMGFVELQLALASDPNQLAAIVKLRHSEELTETEMLAIQFGLSALFSYWQNAHYQYRMGLFDETEFEAAREAWRGALTGNSPHAEYWCENRTTYTSDFAAEIDALLDTRECE